MMKIMHIVAVTVTNNWYRMVVLPALSSPTITSLCSAQTTHQGRPTNHSPSTNHHVTRDNSVTNTILRIAPSSIRISYVSANVFVLNHFLISEAFRKTRTTNKTHRKMHAFSATLVHTPSVPHSAMIFDRSAPMLRHLSAQTLRSKFGAHYARWQ